MVLSSILLWMKKAIERKISLKMIKFFNKDEWSVFHTNALRWKKNRYQEQFIHKREKKKARNYSIQRHVWIILMEHISKKKKIKTIISLYLNGIREDKISSYNLIFGSEASYIKFSIDSKQTLNYPYTYMENLV